MILFADYPCVFFGSRCGIIVDDRTDICLDIMDLSLESLISDTYPVKTGLKQYIHRIEKEWNIEYCIEHRDNLASCSKWYEISESDRCGRDNGEIESIEIVLPDRMPTLEIVYSKSPNDPRCDEYETYSDELAMMDVE